MAFTCLYAASGKKAGRPKRGLPVVTASHRSVMACRKAADFALGKARVCGRAPAPGATGRGAGDLAALAGRIALPVGLAGWVGRGAVTAALTRATDGDGDGAVEPAPHPASR